MINKKILICGAGIAGLTMAFWLRKLGFIPTLLECAPHLRTGGYKVDIRGVALEVIKRMGLHDKIAAVKTDIQGATVVDANGNHLAELSGDDFNLRMSDDLEIMRGDLCQIIRQELDDIEIIFDDSIGKICQGSRGIHVEFEKAKPRLFDLVVGADGLHSTVRKLIFGDEMRFSQHLGLYISIFSVPNLLQLDRWEFEYADSTKLVNLYSCRGESLAKAAFLFRSNTTSSILRSLDEQKQLLRDTYATTGWEVPRLLEAMQEAPDFYFDSVSQICMDSWSKERVVLVGDAGYSASPVSGQGTSLALVGAYILAHELANFPKDHNRAFLMYQKKLRPFVVQNQKLGRTFAKNLTTEDKNKLLVWLHDYVMKILPGKWISFVTKRAVNRVKKAANSISL